MRADLTELWAKAVFQLSTDLGGDRNSRAPHYRELAGRAETNTAARIKLSNPPITSMLPKMV